MQKVLLIADDNLDNVLLIKRIMKRSGLDLKYVEAHSGRDALNLAIEAVPDLILLDMKMPDMDGFETAAAIRATDATGGIPVIAVTAQAMVGDRERALKAGCDEYITKPVDPAVLTDLVRKYLSVGSRTGE